MKHNIHDGTTSNKRVRLNKIARIDGLFWWKRHTMSPQDLMWPVTKNKWLISFFDILQAAKKSWLVVNDEKVLSKNISKKASNFISFVYSLCIDKTFNLDWNAYNCFSDHQLRYRTLFGGLRPIFIAVEKIVWL